MLVGLKKSTNAGNDLASIDQSMGGIGPWQSLSGNASCSSWGSALDGNGNWGNCNDKLLIKAFYRESSTGGGLLSNIGDCKCLSPTPTISYSECYEQDTGVSFDT